MKQSCASRRSHIIYIFLIYLRESESQRTTHLVLNSIHIYDSDFCNPSNLFYLLLSFITFTYIVNVIGYCTESSEWSVYDTLSLFVLSYTLVHKISMHVDLCPTASHIQIERKTKSWNICSGSGVTYMYICTLSKANKNASVDV